jgi:peptidoglycan/LPS O-acetylase OafA/YrhL
MAFLSALSDNLANAVEQRFVDNAWSRAARRLRPALIAVVLLPVAIAIVTYAIHALNAKGSTQYTIFSAIPSWLWLVVGVACSCSWCFSSRRLSRT